MDWGAERRLLKRAGVPLVDATASYRVGGYPRLGLAPLAMKLSSRSAGLLTRQLEGSERERGNLYFSAEGLHKLDIRLANELVSVFVGLSERYPSVWVDRVNFAASSGAGEGALAYAEVASTNWPGVHALSLETGQVHLGELLAAVAERDGEFDPKVLRQMRAETRQLGHRMRGRDLQSHGLIELSACLGHHQCYSILQTYWKFRSELRIAAGRPPRLQPNRVSVAAFILLHEFGHVVEGALIYLGDEAYAQVLGALEDGILRRGNGRYLLSDYRLRQVGLTRTDAHLVNYPTSADKPFSDAATRRRVRQVVGSEVAHRLGSYSKTSRDEMFAEAFALAQCAKDPELRAMLAPFKQSLIDVGLGVARRRTGNA